MMVRSNPKPMVKGTGMIIWQDPEMLLVNRPLGRPKQDKRKDNK